MKLPRLTRRRFFAACGVATAATTVYTWRVEPHWYEVVERDLPIVGLPTELSGRKLVQISDLHIGKLVDDDYIIAAIAHACSLGDLLAITGDFMSCESGEQTDHVARVLEKGLKHPPLGTVAVLGNHDFGRNWKNPAVAAALQVRLEAAGITLLRNDKTEVKGLQIAGVDDLWGGMFHPERAVATIDRDRPSLVLCHNPDGADIKAWHGYRGWILCGHTHGGQCKPPFLPPPLLPVDNARYTAGEFDLGDGRNLYINRGLGYIRRVRFNARPEITVFRLVTV